MNPLSSRFSSRYRNRRRWPRLIALLRRMIPLLLVSTVLVPVMGCKSTGSSMTDKAWWPFKKSADTKTAARDPICPPVEGSAGLPPPEHHSNKIGVNLGRPTPYIQQAGAVSPVSLNAPSQSAYGDSRNQPSSASNVSWQRVQ